jgi:hydrogenase/urease accessory protein HupE
MLEISRTYLMLGVDHILTGLDHLLFIAALMLLIGDWWTLLKTITAFTVAHSLTLVGSVLGYISLPQRPVEAVIALSIAFVASEVIKMRAGELRLSESHPWLVAFAFGLLHGFGFAGALEEIGLPQVDVPLALLMFNVGVESGQILFIGGLLLAFNALKGIFTLPIGPTRSGAAYAIGVISTFWLLSRVAAF